MYNLRVGCVSSVNQYDDNDCVHVIYGGGKRHVDLSLCSLSLSTLQTYSLFNKINLKYILLRAF